MIMSISKEHEEWENALLVMMKNAYEDSVTAASWTTLYAVSRSVIAEAERRGFEKGVNACIKAHDDLRPGDESGADRAYQKLESRLYSLIKGE